MVPTKREEFSKKKVSTKDTRPTNDDQEFFLKIRESEKEISTLMTQHAILQREEMTYREQLQKNARSRFRTDRRLDGGMDGGREREREEGREREREEGRERERERERERKGERGRERKGERE